MNAPCWGIAQRHLAPASECRSAGDALGDNVFNAIKRLFGGSAKLPPREVVAASLLLEVIRMDDDFDDAERAAVQRIVEQRFTASAKQARELIGKVEKSPPATYDDSALLARINAGYSESEKKDLVAMLWEIALADNELHRFENHAILTIANRLGMGQAELDATKAKARSRLGAAAQ